MPELPEIQIMSNFINDNASKWQFDKIFHVQKGNIPIEFDDKVDNITSKFTLYSDSYGKQLKLKLVGRTNKILIDVFMGMSGNWKLCKTSEWNSTKFCRMRLDREDGNSLILYGGYMGPKYKIGGFGTKRGPDPVKDFDDFKKNIIYYMGGKNFNKSICEVLLDQRYFNGVGAYLVSEIVGRLDINPFTKFNNLNVDQINDLINMVSKCCIESYEHGGGELKDWKNPFGRSRIKQWIRFYGSDNCYKQNFGKRNIWIDKKWKNKL